MELIARTYDLTACEYRAGDEIHLTGEEYRRKGNRLGTFCDQFSEPISALDLGCGTGRYFHCLRNTAKIVGIDASKEMLASARNPVRADLIEAEVELRQADIYQLGLRAHQFELAYALGLFGNGTPVTWLMLRRVARWLKPGGIFYFDVVDSASLPLVFWVRKRIRAEFYRLLPRWAQRLRDRRSGWPPFFMYPRWELRTLLWCAGFREVTISSHTEILTQGRGRKLEIICRTART